MPSGLAAYWKKKRSKGRRKATKTVKRRKARKTKEKTKMARRRKRSKRKSAHRRKRRSARRSHKKTRRRKRRGGARRKRRSTRRRKARRGKRRSSRRRRKARRGKRRSSRRRRRKARRSKRTKRIRRRRRATTEVMMPYTGRGRTVRGYAHNPRRRRRRSRRRSSRRLHRRYRRSTYRRNPGGMLIDLAKKAAPVLVGLYGARFLVQKLGPIVPFVSSLGAFSGPALAIGAVLATNYATKKVAVLAKHREPLMLGVGLAALDAFISAFAPASVKSMIGVGDGLSDYIAVGDYVELGATPIDDNMTMSDYIAVGGVEEELGIDEELGVDEELGNDLLGGVSSASMLKTVPTRNFLAPVPARSFTQPVPQATAQYDNAGGLYNGIFRGGF
jgi:hypothetical protein